MEHAYGQCRLYSNKKGEEFWVLREDHWDGRFIKRSNGRRGYGIFYTEEGRRAGRTDNTKLHFRRTAMNGRGGLVEVLYPKNE